MSRQEPIYIKNENSVIRNKDIVNVTTSSDMCIFTKPTYIMSGTTKIPCVEDISCDFSGTDFTTISDNVIQTCFTDNDLSTTTCLSSFTWNVNIYENVSLSYSGTFATTTDFTTLPSDNELYSGLTTGFDTLGYTYTKVNGLFTFEKPYPSGVDYIQVDLGLETNLLTGCTISAATTCGCPSGYTASADDIDCVISGLTTGATSGATFYTATTIIQNGAYGQLGTIFYDEITDLQFPIQFKIDGLGSIVDATNDPNPYPNDTVNPSGVTVSSNTIINSGTFWHNAGGDTDRLNQSGIWGVGIPNYEFIGFSQCVDISVGGVYNIGMGADNYFKFKVNGEIVVALERPSGSINTLFDYWRVFPIYLNSGKNIIEMEAANAGSGAGFAAEIYTADTATLTAATTTSELGIIFTTSGLTGNLYEIGDNSGWNCPSGYTLDTCSGGTPVCTQVSRVNGSCDYSGSCSGDVTTLCTTTYDKIASGDTGVYILSANTGNIDMIFDFTGNTSSFIDNNTIFNYEIYKYSEIDGVFSESPVHQSDDIEWSSFSATSAFTESIPVSNLNIDGNYIVKGYFTHNFCTEFMGLLGKTLDSSEDKSGDDYGLYEQHKDWFFIGIREAEVPVFGVYNVDTNLGNFVVNSFTSTGETEFNINVANQYSFLLALNGLTLALDEDYTFSAITGGGGAYITLAETTVDGDIITIASIGVSIDDTVKFDVFDLTTPIVSGVTDSEGSENVYYNTTTSKYELYTTLIPRDGDNFAITLNGVTLANNIDYYQSVTNPKRIILEGELLVGDIINVFYPANPQVSGNINENTQTIGWTIPTAPTTTQGVFNMDVATDETMLNIVYTSQTEYVINQSSYSTDVFFSGAIGTTLYYRVENEKKYESICGDIITSNAFSEIIPVIIQTNSFNSY